METPQAVYDQKATHFALRFFIRPETQVGGELVVELADLFRSALLFPGSRLTSLDTKRPGLGTSLNMGEFSDRRWNASVKKVLAGEYAVLGLKAETPDFPNQNIWFGAGSGQIDVMCSVSYLRHLAASPEKVEALLQFGRRAWNGIDAGPAYGFSDLAITLARPRFDPDHPPPPRCLKTPTPTAADFCRFTTRSSWHCSRVSRRPTSSVGCWVISTGNALRFCRSPTYCHAAFPITVRLKPDTTVAGTRTFWIASGRAASRRRTWRRRNRTGLAEGPSVRL